MERSHFRRWTADSVARFGDPRRSQYVAAFVCLCFFVDRFRCVFLFTRNLLRGRESGMDGVFSVLTFLDGANGGDLVAVFRAPSAYGNTVKRYWFPCLISSDPARRNGETLGRSEPWIGKRGKTPQREREREEPSWAGNRRVVALTWRFLLLFVVVLGYLFLAFGSRTGQRHKRRCWHTVHPSAGP